MDTKGEILGLKVEAISERGKRILYHTTAILERGEFDAAILLYDDSMSIVCRRVGQYQCLRCYTWRYKQIKSVRFDRHGDRDRMFLCYMTDESKDKKDSNQQTGLVEWDIQFPSSDLCHRFGFRIKTLSRLYHPKKPLVKAPNTVRQNQKEDSPKLDPITANKQIELKSTTVSPAKSPESDQCYRSEVQTPKSDMNSSNSSSRMSDDLFSVENLTRLTKRTSTTLVMEPKVSVPDLKVNLSKEDYKPIKSLETKAAVKIPMTFGSGDNNELVINTEANLSIKFSLDFQIILEAQSILDREARIEHMRKAIRAEAGQCQLTFV